MNQHTNDWDGVERRASLGPADHGESGPRWAWVALLALLVALALSALDHGTVVVHVERPAAQCGD